MKPYYFRVNVRFTVSTTSIRMPHPRTEMIKVSRVEMAGAGEKIRVSRE